VLLDMMLPDMPGGAVAAQLRADPDGRRVPIIVVTADGRAAAKAAAVGAVGHLTKPFDVDQLVEMVLQQIHPAP
jgi:two-component system chemotaxis response regulator CheY